MSPLSPRLRAVLIGFGALAVGAGLLTFAGATETDDWFSWTIQPPLTAATLGAYYWAALALIIGVVAAGTWAAARVAAIGIASISTLLLLATLLHLDKFDFESVFGWFWLAAYVVAPPLFAWALLDQRRIGTRADSAGPRLPTLVRAALGIEGLALVAASLLLWISPDTAADLWPWALTPLTSRAIGAFLLGIALVALVTVADDDLATGRVASDAYVVLGFLVCAAAAIHSPDFGDDDASTAAYVGFWIAVFLTGLAGSLLGRRRAPASRAPIG